MLSFILFLFILSAFEGCPDAAPSPNRLSVIENRIQAAFPTLAFLADNTLKFSAIHRDTGKWSDWLDLKSPTGVHIISNPVSIHGHKNESLVYVQAADGQIWYVQQNLEREIVQPTFTEWKKLTPTSKIPFESGVSLSGKDSVTIDYFKNRLVVFARSVSQNSSHLYWSKENTTGDFLDWVEIGGRDAHLHSDVAVVFNRFSGYYEAFAVMGDGKPYRTWQRDNNKWADWRRHGDTQPMALKTSQPVSHPKSHSFFNDVLEVFILGSDGHLHHIYQTTCDKVDNPWGYCTWGVWSKIGDTAPSGSKVNALTAGNNIHKGNEVFTVDSKGSLWHTWQLEKGDSWKNWEEVGTPGSGKTIISLPFIANDKQEWWMAYVVDSVNQVAVVKQEKSLNVSNTSIQYGNNLTVSWSIPTDEATNKDWIGIYPDAADNDKYLDFRYVQGTQNPKKDPVPKGSVTMQSFLPDGKYNVRYLVNRQFLNVLNTDVRYSNGSREATWIQLYKGLAVGLGTKNTNLVECVEDGNKTVETFIQSFEAFENREVYHGLHLLGLALEDVAKTLVTCLETDIAKAMEKFIADLIACTEGDCLKFTIDLLNELLIILYEDIYEIFGDIRAASNCFNLVKAYEQGGLCIGRVVQACISLPK
ncbi:uncharacterized protein LOC144446407 [Glandiceps talaboti]